MKLVSESAEVNIRPAETFEECVAQNHLDYVPSFKALFDGASEWAQAHGCSEDTADSFAMFYATYNEGKPVGACMPKQRALKIEYTRHLEKLADRHPSRRLMGVSL